MTEAWQRDGRLDPALQFPPWSPASRPLRAVLLTGATGFLGAFVLEELLRRHPVQVFCLVREEPGLEEPGLKEPGLEEPGQSGAARIHRHLQSLGLWDPAFVARIVPVVGDLGLPRLGLEEEAFLALADQVEAIFHCGVVAHFLRPYAALRAVNVCGTTELLRLAGTGGSRPFHHVSTLAVFFDRAGFDGGTTVGGTTVGGTMVSEEDDPEPQGLRSGYVRSKWAAESQVREAMQRGLPATIHRTSRITGHSQTGATRSSEDLLSRMIKACILLGSYPVLPITVSMMPVDYVARAIVHLSSMQQSLGKTFHLFQPAPIPWLDLVGMIGEAGYPLVAMDYDGWRAKLKQAAMADHPEREALAGLWLLLGPDSALLGGRPSHKTPNSDLCLAGSGIQCPPITPALLRCYLAFFRQRGFIPAAAQ